MCVVLVYFLTFCFFLNFLLDNKISDFVNKTSRDKGRACPNEKRNRCNRISSDIILGRNYPTAGYYNFSLKIISLEHIKNWLHSFKKIIKLQFSSKNLSSLINISFAYARPAICIQRYHLKIVHYVYHHYHHCLRFHSLSQVSLNNYPIQQKQQQQTTTGPSSFCNNCNRGT